MPARANASRVCCFLHLSEGNLQWIVNAYTLVFGGFLLLGGRLGDLLGRKRLFLIGLVIFTGASLLDGLAGSEGMLIGARALQGLGAALISPAALSIISTTFEEGVERARALAVWAAIAIGGSAVGLILGGALTQYFSWPWIFFVRSLLTANAAMFLAMSGMFAMFFFNTLYLQQVLGYGPLEAGLAFLPFTAGIMISASLASQLATRIGVRPIAAVGFVLAAGGLVLLTQLPVHGSYVVNVLPALLLSSLGMGAVFMPLTLIATTGLADEDQGLASGLFNTSQQVGEIGRRPRP